MLISIGYRCMLSHVNVLLFSEYVLCNCKIVAIFDDPSLPLLSYLFSPINNTDAARRKTCVMLRLRGKLC